MAQQEPIRVVVEKKGGCFSGCGTALAVLFLLGLAVKFWYISVGLVVLAIAIGIAHNNEQKRKARREPGPRDPWLNQVAVSLSDLGLKEVARNTGSHVGGAPMEGDIGLRDDRFLVYVNLFANADLARQAEVGLRAQANIRDAVGNGQTMMTSWGPVLLVSNGRGSVVDEFRVEEVARAVAEIPLPPRLLLGGSSVAPTVPAATAPVHEVVGTGEESSAEPLEQIRRLAELRDVGLVTDSEFEAKKADLLRRI